MAPSRSASLRVAATRSSPGGEPARSREFACVRGQYGRCSAAGDQIGVCGEDGQRVGVDDHRQIGLKREPQRGSPGVVGAEAGSDRPGLHATRCAGARRGDDFGPVRKHLRACASRVADHARGSGDGGSGAQHGRTGIGRRACQHARDALGVLVVLGPGYRPAGGDVGGVESQHVGGREVETDVDQFDTTAITEGVNGFQAAERHGQSRRARADRRRRRSVRRRRWECRPPRRACPPGRRRRTPRPRCPQRAGAGDADHAVDHQIGCRRNAFHDSAPRHG